MMYTRRRSISRLYLGILVMLGGTYLLMAPAAVAQAPKAGVPTFNLIPTFKLDPSWPKPLPNNWIMGQLGSLAMDARDHLWIIHRPKTVPAAEITGGKSVAPPVIEFDPAGNVVQAWGGPGPGYSWMEENLEDYPRGTPAEHGIYVDHKDNVWVTGNGDQVLKFTRAGKFLMAIGEHFKTGGSNDTRLLGNPTDVAVDPNTNEIFVSDGYLNRRVIVFDADTGRYKRHWGAYGKPPDDGPAVNYEPDKPLPQQFYIVHCLALSGDGLLYVCDRQRNRMQVFRKDGTFRRELVVEKDTPAGAGITLKGPLSAGVTKAGTGSVRRVSFSPDQEQRFLYMLTIGKVVILNRGNLEIIGSFPTEGNHGVRTDSKGNLYTTGNRRPEKFLFTGMSTAPSLK